MEKMPHWMKYTPFMQLYQCKYTVTFLLHVQNVCPDNMWLNINYTYTKPVKLQNSRVLWELYDKACVIWFPPLLLYLDQLKHKKIEFQITRKHYNQHTSPDYGAIRAITSYSGTKQLHSITQYLLYIPSYFRNSVLDITSKPLLNYKMLPTIR